MGHPFGKPTGIYRSKFEATVARLNDLENPQMYENQKFKYIIPQKIIPPSTHYYRPDFQIGPESWLECKGVLTLTNLETYLLVRQYHPQVSLYLLFQRGSNRLSIPKHLMNEFGLAGKNPTYLEWMKAYNFSATEGPYIPATWRSHV